MSGDSPTAHSELLYELKETTISPPINVKCMLDKGIQYSADHIDEKSNSDLAVQEVNHNFEKRHDPPPSRPTAFRRSLENEEAIEHIEEIATSSHVDTSPLKSQENAYVDRDQPDGICLPESDNKEDDSCGIQCLYYTLQCCDCTIL